MTKGTGTKVFDGAKGSRQDVRRRLRGGGRQQNKGGGGEPGLGVQPRVGSSGAAGCAAGICSGACRTRGSVLGWLGVRGSASWEHMERQGKGQGYLTKGSGSRWLIPGLGGAVQGCDAAGGHSRLRERNAAACSFVLSPNR